MVLVSMNRVYVDDNAALKELGERTEQECPEPLGTHLCWPSILVTWSVSPAVAIPWMGNQYASRDAWQLARGRACCPGLTGEV